MSASRLSLVMGSPRPSQENEALVLPLPDAGTIHVHLHLGEDDAAQATPTPTRRSSWVGLVAGLAVVAAFVGGYQIGHRPAQDEVSNLRPAPLPSAFIPPPSGFPAIERQLATQPVILAPPRAAPAASTDHPLDPAGGATTSLPNPPSAPVPTSAPSPARNAFGLEN